MKTAEGTLHPRETPLRVRNGVFRILQSTLYPESANLYLETRPLFPESATLFLYAPPLAVACAPLRAEPEELGRKRSDL